MTTSDQSQDDFRSWVRRILLGVNLLNQHSTGIPIKHRSNGRMSRLVRILVQVKLMWSLLSTEAEERGEYLNPMSEKADEKTQSLRDSGFKDEGAYSLFATAAAFRQDSPLLFELFWPSVLHCTRVTTQPSLSLELEIPLSSQFIGREMNDRNST
ncbi:hypothetical protein P5673_022656 [Acropora cervicornis]|uniref:Uncharacterized protein n=1 Tax=Acropora cervicornis TaxID=6130 RepID=A0AAD9UZG4_ACRCE|nr:hypothetical protein P5673_022656 [Acropora cervicornis]